MTWSAAAISGAAKYKRDQLAARIASGKKLCPRHDGGLGAWLPREEFGPVRSRADGLHGWCRTCVRAGKQAERDRAEAAAAAKAAKNTARARTAAARAIIAGESASSFGGLIDNEDVTGLATARAFRIIGQVEADRRRVAAAAAWRRGSGQPPDPLDDPSEGRHPLGWHR